MRSFVVALIVCLLSFSALAKPTHPKLNRMHSHSSTHHRAKRSRVRGRHHGGRPGWWRTAVMSPIHGSRESLVRQNQMVGQDLLERIEDDQQLSSLTDTQALVPLPENHKVAIESVLPENRRFCRPWTKSFVDAFAEAHWVNFHKYVQVNSAVRTVEVQQSLRRWNGNAAGLEGDTASPHLTGATIAISRSEERRVGKESINRYT